MSIVNETQCAVAMGKLRTIRAEVLALNKTLTSKRKEQKGLTDNIGQFLQSSGRQKVQFGDLVVQAQTSQSSVSMNMVSKRHSKTALEELSRVGVVISETQWEAMVKRLKESRVRTTQKVKLIGA